MTMYRVFENGKRCNEYGLSLPIWQNDSFDTLEEATSYAVNWSQHFLLLEPTDVFEMELNKEYCMGAKCSPTSVQISNTSLTGTSSGKYATINAN
jgi:hypothetical protein